MLARRLSVGELTVNQVLEANIQYVERALRKQATRASTPGKGAVFWSLCLQILRSTSASSLLA